MRMTVSVTIVLLIGINMNFTTIRMTVSPNYIAVADLIPTLHKKTDIKTSLQQIALILAGVVLIVSLHGVAHDIQLEDADNHAVSARLKGAGKTTVQ
jgi:hypothetical protein